MGYGKGEYGQRGFGGASKETAGPSLVTSDPLDTAVDIAVTAPVSFTISSPAGLDEFSLDVLLEGAQAIVGGIFQPGYAGTISYDPETTVVVNITTHPIFAGGATPLAIDITDLSGASVTLNISWTTVDNEIVAETITLSEALSFGQDYVIPVPETVTVTEGLMVSHGSTLGVAEAMTVSASILTGSLQIEVLDGETLLVRTPFELEFTQTRELGNFNVEPGVGPTAGLAVNLVSVELGFDTFQTGASVRVVDLFYRAEPIFSNPLFLGVEGFSSNVLDFIGTGTFTDGNITEYIEIVTGQSAGVYQILDTYITNQGYDIEGVPGVFVNRVLLDRPLVVKDIENGYVEGLCEVVSPSPNAILRLVHPNINADDPLLEIMRLDNRTQGSSKVQPAQFFPYKITIIDHNTFQYNDDEGDSFPAAEGDRIFLQSRVTSKLTWRHISGVQTLTFKTRNSPGTKFRNSANYTLSIKNLFVRQPRVPFRVKRAPFAAGPAVADRPRVIGAEFLPEGIVVVAYDQNMRIDDENLANTDDYTITGPSTITVKRVWTLSPTLIAIEGSGFEFGNYTVSVSTSTPTDIAGNPLDPVFNAAAFLASVPLTVKSVFTDKGPIARPPLTLQTGSSATINTFTEVTLPGATLTSAEVGKYVTFASSASNDGTFRIAGVISATMVRLANASFTVPDANSGSIGWTLFDPRDGQIADDPADVTVLINGLPVVPDAVVGLLGQVVLPSEPLPTDDVKIDYSWCCNPTVEIRRLNSKEFRLNAWNRDRGFPKDASQHKYRFNNVLVRPSEYVPTNLSAPLEQPELRELHYRSYERAYTPVLNDPTLLLLNSPIHKIAFPQATRLVSEEFVAYEGIGLPEALITDPWTRVGAGQASSAAGVLTVEDDATGVFPTGEPVFWTRTIDLTFRHVFAMTWRFSLDVTPTFEGVWTGIAAGYSDENLAVVIGYLEDGGVKKLGVLVKGSGDDPSLLSAWTGGIDAIDAPTNAPADFDWSILHSYRIFRDLNGVIKVFVDGDVVEILRVLPAELPTLKELNASFDAIQGAFFGSLSRPAESTSTWDFVRYLTLPTNPQQTSPSSFVSYEANVIPEEDPKPWTPVGFHGTETIQSSDFLLLDNTSATDTATSDEVGLIGGDYRGFVRMEPLLQQASEYVFDVNVQLITHTYGISDRALMFAVDDGNRVAQVAFLTARDGTVSDPNPPPPEKLSYGGRSLPEDFSPFAWTVLGTASAVMQGRILRITDIDIGDGKVYSLDDAEPVISEARVIGSTNDSIFEFRNKVISYTADGSGFAGAFGQVFDGTRAYGILLQDDAGTKYVAFHSDGTVGALARFAFDWDDGAFHTYRLTKSTGGNLVSLFIDGTFVGSETYSSFTAPPPDPIGQLSWGSSTPASAAALSTVDWGYVNAWRLFSDTQRYVGIWKGSDSDSLLGYHLPLKTSGKGANVLGNALGDGNADFIAASVMAGDKLIVDVGANQGVYSIAAVVDGQNLTITAPFPAVPTLVDYRIAQQTDWSAAHKYRLTRSPSGVMTLLLDAVAEPLLQVGYNSIDLPSSAVGIVRTLANGLPAMVFGSFDPTNLSQSRWDYARYGITKSVTEQRIAPHHQVLNQWNVMASHEHNITSIPHDHTDFKSSSTGIPPKVDPDFMENPLLLAFTQLNEDTPLVPSTQTFEVRAPYPVQETISGLNRPEDVLNNDGDFVLNHGALRFKLIVPDDILYSCLDVIEQTTGEQDLIAPFTDFMCGPDWGTINYQDDVCLEYDGAILPELDTTAGTPWELVSDDPGEVSTSAFSGILTYATGATGTKTVYRNNSPLPDAPSLETEARFRMRILADSTLGTADSQIRIGMSAPGMTVALGFVTTPLAERYVFVLDLNNGAIMGSATFDYLDGAFHTYRLVRNPSLGTVRVFIDS